jgi:hypothetical protein
VIEGCLNLLIPGDIPWVVEQTYGVIFVLKAKEPSKIGKIAQRNSNRMLHHPDFVPPGNLNFTLRVARRFCDFSGKAIFNGRRCHNQTFLPSFVRLRKELHVVFVTVDRRKDICSSLADALVP